MSFDSGRPVLTAWRDVEMAAPEFARRVRNIFERRRHNALATLRRDGSPRLSGIETQFEDGELILGMMPGSVKLADIRRDPRIALQAMPDDPPGDNPAAWGGDAKVSGRAVELADPKRPGEPANRFPLKVEEVVLTRVGEGADHLVIESWHPGRGLETRRRR